MTQQEFNEMLAVAIAGGLGGGTYPSRWDGEEIDTGLSKLLLPGGIVTPDLADGSVTWPKLSPEARKSNPNLLDNAYFIGGGSQQAGGQFPVNQRGLTEYTSSGYTIDRWCNRNNSLIKLESDGLRISSVDGNGTIKAFNQRFENYASLLGKTVTLSALIIENNVIGSDATLMVAGADNVLLNTNILISTPIAGKTGLVTVTAKIPATIDESGINIGIYIGRNGSSAVDLKIAAMKLELGPIQTLAHQDADGNWVLNDPPPKFGAELAECQRYQWKSTLAANGFYSFPLGIAYSKTILVVNLPLPVTMRAGTPTMLFSTGDKFGCWNTAEGSWTNDAHLISNISIDQFCQSSISLSLITTGLTPGRPYQVQTQGGYILIDNNL